MGSAARRQDSARLPGRKHMDDPRMKWTDDGQEANTEGREDLDQG